MSRAITESVWRNDKPFAPIIEVDAFRGQPLEIPLTDYLVQGAKDLDIVDAGATKTEIATAYEESEDKRKELISEFGARRSWACNYFNISKPSNGNLYRSLHGNGFRYISRPNYIGKDCFSYVINNSFQNSHPGQIIINVQNYFEGRIIIEEDRNLRTPNRRAFRYIAQWYIPPGFLSWYPSTGGVASFSHVVVRWFQHRPQRFMVGGVPVVRTVKEQVGATRLTMNSRNSKGFEYINQNYAWPSSGMYIQEWPDTTLSGARDELTDAPYQQPNGPYPISVEISFRRQKVTKYKSYYSRYGYNWRWRAEWLETKNIEVDVRSLYGNDWWRSGNIINTRDPSYRPTSPGVFTPVDLST